MASGLFSCSATVSNSKTPGVNGATAFAGLQEHNNIRCVLILDSRCEKLVSSVVPFPKFDIRVNVVGRKELGEKMLHSGKEQDKQTADSN